MTKFGIFFASLLGSAMLGGNEAFVVPSSTTSAAAAATTLSHEGYNTHKSLLTVLKAAANDGNDGTSSSSAPQSNQNNGNSNNKKKSQRPDTRLQMSDTFMEQQQEAVTDPAELIRTADSFESLMQRIIQDKPQDEEEDTKISAEDLRLLKKLLEGQFKSKFERDSYWEKVRKPVNEATTIPPEVFRSQEFYDLEREKILGRSWVCVGTTDQVRNRGDTVSVQAAGQPVIVTRTKRDGELQAFFNVCRHRGSRLVSDADSGTKHSCFKCPYHSWTYGLDGKLLSTPNWNTNADGHQKSKAGRMMSASGVVENFSKEDSGLIPVRVETWGPFVYVNLSGDAPPVADYLGRVTTDLDLFPFDDLVTVKEDKFEVNANWKLLAENYIDFYHLSTVHPTYAQVSRPDDHIRAQGDGMYCGYVTYPLTSNGDAMDLGNFPIMKNIKGTKHEKTGWFQIHFPNMFFFLLPHSLFMVMLEPTSVGTTVEHCRLLVDKDSLAEAGETADKALQDIWDYYYAVNTEDFEICEKTQVGIAAHAFTGGRMAYAYEESLNRYHKMIANCMTDNPYEIPAGDATSSYYDNLPVFDYQKYEEEAEEPTD